MKEAGLVKRALIIAPPKVMKDTWPGELEKWSNFSNITYTILHGNKKEELLDNDTDLYIINFEGMKWLLEAEYTSKVKVNGRLPLASKSDKIKRIRADMLIIDELSRFKGVSTMQTRLMFKIAGMFKIRIGLTGTPQPNSLFDVYSQTRCVDLGATFGKSFTKYKYNYFNRLGDSYKWELKDGAEEEIYRKLAPIVIQRDQQQRDGLPELTYIEIPVKLPPKVQTLYNTIKKKFIAEYESKTIDAFNAAVKTLKLRQIASGGLYHTTEEAKHLALESFKKTKVLVPIAAERETVILHDEKTQALMSLIDGLNGVPLLVFYSFNHDVDNITAALGDVPILNKTKDLRGLIKDWNAGNIPVMLLNAKSGAHGLNLQESGADICWYTLEWSHEIHEQAIHRVWRQGNPAKETRVYYLLAEDTIDYYVLKTVQDKGDSEQRLFSGVRAYYESLKGVSHA
jgi:SNF2 family DNA or RNA helicase